MTVITITSFGRFGNSIIQIINCINIALQKGYNKVVFPEHNFLSSKEIILKDVKSQITEPISGIFFSSKDILSLNCSVPCFTKKRKIALEYIIPILKVYRLDSELLSNLGDEDVICFHIRGGDIFIKSQPHPGYIQPPLWFYEKIIEQYKWKKVILVSEDNLNPVVPELLKKYPELVNWNKRTLEQDISIILNARNIAIGVGTFCTSIFLLSNTLPKIWVTDISNESILLKGIDNLNVLKCPGYIKSGEWKNTKEQREIMVSYKPE